MALAGRTAAARAGRGRCGFEVEIWAWQAFQAGAGVRKTPHYRRKREAAQKCVYN
jgi:hypothetical protein